MSVQKVVSQIQLPEFHEFLEKSFGNRRTSEGILLHEKIFSIVQEQLLLPGKASVKTVLENIDQHLGALDSSTIDSVKSAVSTLFQTLEVRSLPEADERKSAAVGVKVDAGQGTGDVQKRQSVSEEKRVAIDEISSDIWSHISQFLSDKDKLSLAQVSQRVNIGVRRQSVLTAHRLCNLFLLDHPQFRTSTGDVDLSQIEERSKASLRPEGRQYFAMYDHFVSRLKELSEATTSLKRSLTGLQAQNPIWVSRFFSEVSLVYDKALDVIISALSAQVPEELQKKLAQIPPHGDETRNEELQKVFREIATLPTLSLSLEDLPILPSELFLLTNLRELWIDRGTFVTVPREIGNLKNLEVLQIFKTHIQELPSEIGALEHLRDLYLSDNALTSLPPEIGRFVNLVNLFISRNAIKQFPSEIGRLVNLELLVASQNKLTDIPPEIGNLVRLRHFSLADNALTILPLEIGRLINLAGLDVTNNPIRSIPVEIGRLGHLQIFGDPNIRWSSGCVMQ